MNRKSLGSIRGRVLLLVAGVLVVALGDMRPLASQAATRSHRPDVVSNQRIAGDSFVDTWATLVRIADPVAFETRGDSQDSEEVVSPPVAVDDGEFVPAIYAWDPDVRFVYHRHVSKWM